MTTGRPRDAGIGTISAMVAALAIALVTAPQPASAQGPLSRGSMEVGEAITHIQAAIAADQKGDVAAALAHDEAALEHDQAALKLLLMDADRGSMEVGEAITHIQAAIAADQKGDTVGALAHDEAALEHDQAALKPSD